MRALRSKGCGPGSAAARAGSRSGAGSPAAPARQRAPCPPLLGRRGPGREPSAAAAAEPVCPETPAGGRGAVRTAVPMAARSGQRAAAAPAADAAGDGHGTGPGPGPGLRLRLLPANPRPAAARPNRRDAGRFPPRRQRLPERERSRAFVCKFGRSDFSLGWRIFQDSSSICAYVYFNKEKTSG